MIPGGGGSAHRVAGIAPAGAKRRGCSGSAGWRIPRGAWRWRRANRRRGAEIADALAERLAVFGKHAARFEIPEEIALAPEPAEAPGVAEWLRAASRRSQPEGLVIRAPAEMRSPQGADTALSGAGSSHAPAGRSTR